MSPSELQSIFERIKQFQRPWMGDASPYSILIILMLENSSADFCLRVIEAASKIASQKNRNAVRRLSMASDLTTERRYSVDDMDDVIWLSIFNEELDAKCQAIAKQAVHDFLVQRQSDLSQSINEGE